MTVVLSAGVILYGLPAMPAEALNPPTPEALATAHGLATFASAMDALADVPSFATKLPLTDRSPADILGFPTLFTRTLGAPLVAFSGDYTDLSSAIAGASGSGVTYTVPGGITVAGDVATFTVHAVATATQNVPIVYTRAGGEPDDPNANPAISVHGTDTTTGHGTVPVSMTLTGDFPFRMDKSVVVGTDIDVPNALSLDPAGTHLTLTSAPDNSTNALSFTSRYGFTDVTVTGSAAYDIAGATTFTDPDANGKVTQDEWSHTLFGDWARFALAHNAHSHDDVNVSLTFDSSLLPSGTHGGTVYYRDQTAPTYVDNRTIDQNAPAPSVPTVSLVALEPFTKVGADDALTGLSQFSASLAAAQARINDRLPLLDKRMSDAFLPPDETTDVYSPAGQLQGLVERQGSAAIVCGKADTQPPSGADLAGTTWYCQAVTRQDVTGVQWARHDGVSGGLTNATTATTVGMAPTTNMRIDDVVGEPNVSVSFDVTQEQPSGGTATVGFTAEPRIRSAQELQAALDALTGSTVTMAYDATAKTLTYAVGISGDPDAIDAGFDIGDALRPKTGLSGLQLADPDAKPVSLDVGEVSLAATYGLLLTDDVAGLDPDDLNSQNDRYFIELGSGHEISVESVTATPADSIDDYAFTGRVGYLAVDAAATSFALDTNASGDVLDSDLTLDPGHQITDAQGDTIANAMLLRRLLASGEPVAPTFNLKLDAAFDVNANGNLSSLTTGTDQASVDVQWHDYGNGTTPAADGNDAYDTYLKLFDVLPLVEGKAGNATASTEVLTDDDTDFLTAFGHNLAAGTKLPATLINATTGATCEDVTVTDAHTLTCDASSTVDDGTGTPVTVEGMSGGQRTSVRTGVNSSNEPTYETVDGDAVTTPTYADDEWRAGDQWRVAGDQSALGHLLLENLYDIANKLDTNANPDYVAPIAMVGLTPKQLTPQFGKIRDIAAAIAARVPVTAQAAVWKKNTTYTVGTSVTPTTPGALLFTASAGTTGGTEPTWPTTAGGTVTDGTVTWTAVAPAPTPPETMQALISALTGEMNAVTLPVGDVSLVSPTVGLDLAKIAHTLPNGTTLSNKPHAQLTVTWNGAAVVDAPVDVSLEDMSHLHLHGLADDNGHVGAMNVSTNSSAKIRFAVPLSPDIPSGDVVVRADTGVSSLTATVDTSTVDFTASVGSVALALGQAAHLFGRHTPVTGTHTAATSVLSGTFTNFTASGTADSGSTAATLVDNDYDFVARGVATGATVTNTANSKTCSVSSVAQHQLTCTLADSAVWASGNGWSLTQVGNAKVATASGLASPGFSGLVAGDVIRQGAANCTVTSGTAKTQTTIDCQISSGTWNAGSTFTVERAAVLTDGARTGSATSPTAQRPFSSFPASSGATIVNTTRAASCAAGTAGTTTLPCSGSTALSGGATWQQNDAYRYDLGDVTKVLVDPGRGFDTMGLVGRTLTNTTDNATCVVASATADTLTCTAALTNSGSWTAGDYYEVDGPGIAKMSLADWHLTGIADDDPVAYVDPANLTASKAGALAKPSCSDTPSGAALTDDACAILAAQLVDPAAAHGTVGSVASNVVTVNSATSPANLTTAGIKAGTSIRDLTAKFNCVVTAVTATTFTCVAPSGKTWAAAHVWRVDDGAYLGVLKFHAAFASDTSDAEGLGSAFTGAVAGDEPLEFSLLTVAMNLVKGYVSDAFDGTLADEPFPLIGLDRSAGSHVMDALQKLEDVLAENPPPDFKPTDTMASFKASLETYVANAIADTDGLAKVLSAKTSGNGNTGVTITLLCGATPHSTPIPCTGTQKAENILDVRVQTTIGGDAAKSIHMSKGCTATTCEATTPSIHLDRFDSGLPGLQLSGPNGLDVEAGWTFDVDFGLARDVGPYLGTHVTPTGGTADPALEIGASVHLPDASTDCTATRPANANTLGFSTRCFRATLGLLQAVVFDGTGGLADSADGTEHDRTGLELKASIDLEPAATDGRISLDSLLSPDSDAALPEFTAQGDGNIDLYFVTGVAESGTSVGTTLPSVQGTVHLGFHVDGALSEAGTETGAFTDASYDDLMMDAGSFVRDFMQPIVSELYALTRPFKAIADILMAPIPVLKQIAEMTGQQIGTLLDILEQAAQGPLQLVRSVIGIVNMIADIASSTVNGLVGLGAWGNGVTEKGGFKVAKKNTTQGPCGKTVDGKKQPKDCTKQFKQDGTKYKQSVVQLKNCPANGCTGKELARTMTRGSKVQKFDGFGITFPFLNDTSQVMGLLVGENATLVRFDPGAFGVSASLNYSWGPFMAGPVPVEISVGGTIGLSAHFAVGYDTRGIMNMLKQDPDDFDASALTDGIFIDDLDLGGNDVDEIQLTFVVTLGASVSISIFKVGLYGGVGITIEFDLNDPDHDGKLYIDEIEEFKDNPICLFKVRGLLDFFFGFFVEVDLVFWSKRWDVELFRLKPPITLFESSCERFEPDLAVAESGNLRLNMGDGTAPNGHTYAFNRHYRSTRTNEKFVVRQLAPYVAGQATQVQVEFQGLVQQDTVPANGRIVADAGSGNDGVELASGATADGAEIPFMVPATVNGGAGDDQLTTGGGADVVHGNGDTDKVVTGGGDDSAFGDDGNDNVDGGLGNDLVYGGNGDDRVNGNAGSDYADGGADTDTVNGGPGLNATQLATARTRNPDLTDDEANALLDGADVLVGGTGEDTLSGHFGDDYLFGGNIAGIGGTDRQRLDVLRGASTAVTFTFATACTAATSSDGDDQLNGEAGNDTAFGDNGDDRLSGALGDDRLCGGAGADFVEGDSATSSTPGDDTLFGGTGNDQLYARGGADVLDAGAGDDFLDAGDGDDKVTGGAGSDAIAAGTGSDIVLGDGGTIPSSATIVNAGNEVKSLVATDTGTDIATGATPIVCRSSANVLSDGRLDLDGNGVADSGRFLGRRVTSGRVQTDATTPAYLNGTLGDRVVSDGYVQGGESSVSGIAMTLRGSADCVLGGNGNDAVFAGPGDDVVVGDANRDYVQGDQGNDYLRGYQDADEIDGGAGSDDVYGDTGADLLTGGAGDDTVHGGIDADVAYGGPGNDAVSGEDGDDVLVGGSGVAATADGNDTIDGGAGADVIAGDNATPNSGHTDVTLLDLAGGFAGNDTLAGQTENDTIYGQGGNDAIRGDEGNDRLDGNQGDDTIDGNAGNDVIAGGTEQSGVSDGNDTVHGGQGNDTVFGDNATATGGITLYDGAGADTLWGDEGDDGVYGQGGNDLVRGDTGDTTGTGADYLEGGPANDTIWGAGGADKIVGGSAVAGTDDGADTIHGGAGTDTITGDNALVTAVGVTLRDVDDLAASAPSGAWSGGDTINGDADADSIYAQGGDDTVHGDAANDYVEGDSGDDHLYGDDGDDRLIGGNAVTSRRDGDDVVSGGNGLDAIAGDNATIGGTFVVTPLDLKTGGASVGDEAGDDTITGDANDDTIYAEGANDTVHGNDGNDYVEGGSGSDHVYGDAGNDRLMGGSSTADVRDDETVGSWNDTIEGNDGDDLIAGDNGTITTVVTLLDVKKNAATVGPEAGPDLIDGGTGVDTIYGEGGDDTVHAGDANDYVEGNSGDDTVYGENGDDRLIGGTADSDVIDGDDYVSGGDGTDVVTGDNASVSPAGSVVLLDVRTSGQSVGTEAGDDTLFGDAGTDTIYAESGDDEVHGGDADDYAEGNAGDDEINGGAGLDRLVGGSGTDRGGASGAIRELRDSLDGADTIHGNEDADVEVGDNARIDASNAVTLYDEDVSGQAGPPADVSGPDTMTGDAGTDRMYGQGDDDTMSGGSDKDVMEGNSGADTMSGNEDDDNLTGGTTRDGAIRDGADTMNGNEGVDVMLGDNGTVNGSGMTAKWTFYDLDLANAAVHVATDLSGNDTMHGDDGVDFVFGQGGDDTMTGNDADDRMQGNAGADTIEGDEGADDITGGSAYHYVGATLTALPGQSDGSDTIAGDDPAASHGLGDKGDTIVADNGRIDRTGAFDPNTADAVRTVTLFDVAVSGAAQPHAGTKGDDTVKGDNGRDEVLGGGGNDTIHGNDGDDHLEGNAGADTITGDAGDDDVVGGGSSLANGVVRHTAPAVTTAATVTNLVDGDDTVDGGTGEDAVLGDNGVVARTLAVNGTWLYHAAPFQEIPKRTLQVPTSHELAGSFGNDALTGGAGHDEIYGELGNDTVTGDGGDDALLGDLGRIDTTVNGKGAGQNGKAATVLKDSASFLVETVYVANTLQRDTTLYDIAVGGSDVLDGGTGNDALHGGAGNDTLSGNAGATDADAGLANVCVTPVLATCDRDVIFGGDGDDTMWGGSDKDHMYGGYGTDHIDVVRPGTVNAVAKFKGPDVMYGGWQQDAMQADVSAPSPNGDDKLIDATGVYNIYYVCEGAYGGNSVVRSPSPSMISTLQSLATADGATTVTTKNTSGFDEISMVFTNEFSANSSPAFLDSPGSFTCV